MKKLMVLGAATLLTTCLAGCNRAWPGCFGRGLWYAPPVYAAPACDTCDTCGTDAAGSYYVEPGAEWVPATSATIDPLPTPGPTTDSTPN